MHDLVETGHVHIVHIDLQSSPDSITLQLQEVKLGRERPYRGQSILDCFCSSGSECCTGTNGKTASREDVCNCIVFTAAPIVASKYAIHYFLLKISNNQNPSTSRASRGHIFSEVLLILSVSSHALYCI
jgi:hypothetical protein